MLFTLMKDCSWYSLISFMEILLECHIEKRFMVIDYIAQGGYVDNCLKKLAVLLQSAELYYRYFHDACLVNFYM